MRILHVLPALKKGGGERVAVELANYAAAKGDEVSILASYPVDAALLQDTVDKKIEIRFISEAEKGRYGKFTPILPWLIKNHRWVNAHDVVHLHLTYGSIFGTIMKTYLTVTGRRCPAIIETYHGVGMAVKPGHRWFHGKLAGTRDALALMTWDDYWKGVAERHPDLLTRVIPNGISFPNMNPVDAEAREQYKKQTGIQSSCKYVVGTISMLRTDRQPGRYIPIFEAVAKQVPEAHFLIVGEGPERDNLETLIRESGLSDRVHLPGLAVDPRTPLSVIDVYVALNLGPITGMAGLEAAFRRLPVIAIQNYAGYTAGAEDWIWSHTDSNEVAKKIVGLLKSEEERKKLSISQFQYAMGHFTTEAMGQAYDQLYTDALDKRKRKKSTSGIRAGTDTAKMGSPT